MPREPRELEVEWSLRSQLSRSLGSFEIESAFALQNKIRAETLTRRMARLVDIH